MIERASTRFLHYSVAGIACTIALVAIALFLGVSGFTGEEKLSDPGNYFDAVNYTRIATEGYNGLYLHAFFPLFPLLLKLMSSTWLAAAFNAMVFCISAAALASDLRPSLARFLLFFTLPSCLFFLLPYSEALFFAGGSVFLLSLRREAVWLGALGLVIAGLSRPAASVFLPALLLLFWLNPKSYPFKSLLVHGVAVLVSFFGAWFIQCAWNGEWAQFFEAQKAWGNEFRMPSFPFSTWGSDRIVLWLDLFALTVGAVAGTYLISLGIQRIRGNILTGNVAFLFSMLYLAGISAMILLFRGGELFSLNRFVFAVPFTAWVVFSDVLKGVSKRWISLAFVFLALLFLLHGAYVHIKVVLGAVSFLCCTAVWIAAMRSAQKQWAYAALVIAFLWQGYFLLKLVRIEWIAELWLQSNEIIFGA